MTPNDPTIRCAFCGRGGHITVRDEVQRFPYGIDGPGQVTLGANVNVYTCGLCREQWTDHESEDARQAAVDRHLLEVRNAE